MIKKLSDKQILLLLCLGLTITGYTIESIKAKIPNHIDRTVIEQAMKTVTKGIEESITKGVKKVPQDIQKAIENINDNTDICNLIIGNAE